MNLGSLLNPGFHLLHQGLLLALLNQSCPSRTKQVDPKKRREQKGKDILETGKPRPTNEEEAHRAAKQQKVSHAPSRRVKRADSQFPEPQAWLLAPMLGGELLMDDASIWDFNGGIGCHVASALEQTLLLPKDMVCTYSLLLFFSFFPPPPSFFLNL